MSDLEFAIELFLVRQLPEILSDLEFAIELYLVRQVPKDTEGYTWISIHKKGVHL